MANESERDSGVSRQAGAGVASCKDHRRLRKDFKQVNKSRNIGNLSGVPPIGKERERRRKSGLPLLRGRTVGKEYGQRGKDLPPFKRRKAEVLH